MLVLQANANPNATPMLLRLVPHDDATSLPVLHAHATHIMLCFCFTLFRNVTSIHFYTYADAMLVPHPNATIIVYCYMVILC